MSGNVWEWCNDWHDDGYYKDSPKSNPQGPDSGTYSVLRGGCWGNSDYSCRVAYRYRNIRDYGNYLGGFRIARTSQ